MKIKFYSLLFTLSVTSLAIVFSGNTNIQDEGNLYIYTNQNYLPSEEVKISTSVYNVRSSSLKIKLYKVIDPLNFIKEIKSTQLHNVRSFDEIKLMEFLELTDEFDFRLRWSRYNWSNETYSLGKIERKGIYLIAVQVKNLKSFALISVSTIGLITKNSESQILVYVSNRLTSEPIENAKVNLVTPDQQVLSYKTNSSGIVFHTFDENSIRGKNFVVVGNKNDEPFISENPIYYYINQYDKFKVYTYTNQPVYRPNQKVYFKSIIRNNDFGRYENAVEQELTVSIRNPKNEEVFSKKFKTNNNGTIDGYFELEDEPALGDYAIHVLLSGNTYSSSFTVEEYKKPEFKVEIETDKSQYTFKDVIKAKVKANYYFGSPVSTANVRYEIYRRDIWRPWWYFEPYAWFYRGCFVDYYPAPRNILIHEGEGIISSIGEFSFEYKIEEKSEIDYEYFIVAKVTDQSRREIQGSNNVFVTRGEFQLSTNPEKYLSKPKERVMIKIRAYDFSEQSIQTKFTAYVRKQLFEGNETYLEEIDTLYGETKSDGIGYVYFYPAESGKFSYLVKAYDSKNNIITAKGNFWISDQKGLNWNIGGGIQIITDKEVYEPGDTLNALITAPTCLPTVAEPGGQVENAKALFTIEYASIINYQIIEFNGYSATITKKIKDDSPSILNLNLSFFYQNTYFSGTKRIAVLPKNKFLTVDILNDKDIYKPNTIGEVTISVRDFKGMPVQNAELSIGTIDESIYAIKDESTPEIKTFFYSGMNYYIPTSFTSTNRYFNYDEVSNKVFEKESLEEIWESVPLGKEAGKSSIKGKVIDELSDNPIKDAEIILQKGKLRASTESNSNGEFDFNELGDGTYSIIIKAPNYESKIISKIILLRNEVKNLGEVLLSPVERIHYPIRLHKSSAMVLLGRGLEEKVYMAEAPISGVGGEEKFVTAQVRSDFRDAILWEPAVITNSAGIARVKIKYPDNLTTWRSTVRVVTTDTKVGQNISKTTTRKDLIVRMEVPRYLRQKDEVTISTIVHNYLSEEKLTKVSFKAKNASVVKSFINSKGYESEVDNQNKKSNTNEWKIKIPQNSEIRIDWIIKVENPTNEIVLTAEALTNEESDAVEMKIPVEPYGVEMVESDIASTSDYSVVIKKTINIPKNIDIRNVKLTLTTSPSLAGTILGALDDLIGYPYGCVEQTMSRFLPTILVANVFHDLNAPLKEGTIAELPKIVSAGLKRLYDFQHNDGGWGWWTNDKTHPFMTAYVVYGLALTKKAGYQVDINIFERGIENLKSQLKSANELDDETRAYMIYSLAFANEAMQKFDYDLFDKEFLSLSANASLREKNKDNSYINALLAIAANKYNRKEFASVSTNALLKTAIREGNSIYWSGEDWKYRWQEDKVQTTALSVRALIGNTDQTELIEKAVRWLLLQRRGTSWSSTKQTAMVIFALTDYLKTSKELDPNFSAAITINDEPALNKFFTKENLFEKESKIVVDSKYLKSGENKIKIVKHGEGKLYYSSQTKYYSEEKLDDPITNVFEIERSYYFIKREKEGDRFVHKLTKFTGKANPGDEIFVRVKVKSKNSQEFFMLEDPIPPGCEVVKESDSYFIQNEIDYRDRIIEPPYWRWTYADKEIRDEKIAFFVTNLNKGEFEFSYILRAQIPGIYNVMPSTGSLMYYPEVRGTSQFDKFEIRE